MLYLDNAATSYKKPLSVYAAMAYHTVRTSANAGRGASAPSMRAVSLITDTAERLAMLFGISDPSRIAFTGNATGALNQAVRGVMKGGGHAVITSMEHNSLIRPIHDCCEYTMVSADITGLVSPDNIESALRPDTRLIAIAHASNVCGAVEPVRAIGKIAKKHGIIFLVDAAQTAGCEEIDVDEMNIDMLAFSGHKGLLGPLGTGGLYVREGVEIEPTVTGGTGSMSESLSQPRIMPDMLQTGTMNAPAIGALGRSVRYISERGIRDIADSERYMAAALYSELKNMRGITVYGSHSVSRNGTVCFNVNGADPVEISTALSERFGIITRGGLHCAYRAHLTIGSGRLGGVRASFGAFNRESDVKRLVNAVLHLRDDVI
jgi:cysteine desulfurase family protein